MSLIVEGRGGEGRRYLPCNLALAQLSEPLGQIGDGGGTRVPKPEQTESPGRGGGGARLHAIVIASFRVTTGYLNNNKLEPYAT